MNSKTIAAGVVGLALVAVGLGLWSRSHSSGAAGSGGRKILFYQDSMHPWVKMDRQDKCPICSMALTPIFEGMQAFSGSESVVALGSNSIAALNVQTEEVKRRPFVRELRVAGTLEPNETRRTLFSAPSMGRIEELAVDQVGTEVTEGQLLVTLYSPELAQAKRRYILRSRPAGTPTSKDPGDGSMAMKLDGDPYYHGLVSPQAGVVTERKVSNGQYVAEGDRLFTIVDPSVLWFRFDVYERQLAWFEQGQPIEVTVPAIPGKVFKGTVTLIEPSVSEGSRSFKVRADIANPLVESRGQKGRMLRFGMTADGLVRAEIPDVLAVSRSAVLFPGSSAYVYVEKTVGVFERRRVELGRQADQTWEVLGGLDPGERVVVAGNVLIDAQAQFNQSGHSEEADIATAVSSVPLMGGAQSLGLGSAPLMQSRNPYKPSDSTRAPRKAPRSMAAPGGGAMEDMTAEGMGKMKGGMGDEDASGGAGTDGQAGPGRRNPTTDLRVRQPRDGLGDSLWTRAIENRAAEAAAARPNTPAVAKPVPLSNAQHEAVELFLQTADQVGMALAADDLAKFNDRAKALHQAAEVLGKTIAGHPLMANGVPAMGSAADAPAKDLAEARKRFLPFSSALVEISKSLRRDDPIFASLKIYHCPMAPKPGLWIQSKGPLKNPFFGAEMLGCGEEVKK